MKTPRDRYLNDVYYKTLVDTMVSYIDQCKFTPSEMREASILASIIYEERNINRIRIISPEIEEALNTMHNWIHNKVRPKSYDQDKNRIRL